MGIYSAGPERSFALVQRMRLRVANLPAKHVETRLADLDAARYAPAEWAKVEQFATDGHANREQGRGLLLAGPPGQGKTMAACALMNEARYRRKSWVRFQTLPDLLQLRIELIRLDKRADRGDEAAFQESERLYSIIKRIEGDSAGQGEPPIGLLVLDDVGKERKTDSGFASAEFDRLIRGRFNRGLPTIITTNLPLGGWDEGYHESTFSFMREGFVATSLVTGGDFRARG